MIETARLRLVPCGLAHFEAILAGDESALSSLLGACPAADWLGFPEAREAIAPSYEHLKSHPAIQGWWMYLFTHTEDRALIGVGGFKGPPDEEGRVEIGYSIAPAYRQRGLATEAARGLIDYAFADARVRTVLAHTLPVRNHSVRVLERVGMKFEAPVEDPSDGPVWRWRLPRGDEGAGDLSSQLKL